MTKEKDGIVDNNEEMSFTFNAIQIVNRFLEVYAIKQETRRLEEIETLFAENASIFTLKNKNVLLNGRSSIINSFISTNKCSPTCTRRIFIEIAGGVSFCYDLYPVGKSPGLGNPEKGCILLYRCLDNVFTHIYGMADSDNFSSKQNISSDDIFTSAGWKLATEVISSIDTVGIDIKDAHFHDYTNLEVWG